MVGILCGTIKCLECLLQRCFSWSPTAPWGRDHSRSNVGHLFSHLVDVTVLCICILSDMDKDVLRVTNKVGLENILRTTLEQLADVYDVLKHAPIHLKCRP